MDNLFLRQQLIVLRPKHPDRVRLVNLDRLLLVWLYRLFPALLDANLGCTGMPSNPGRLGRLVIYGATVIG